MKDTFLRTICWKKALACSLMVFTIFSLGCAANMASRQAQEQTAEEPSTKMITAIHAQDNDAAVQLTIESNQKLTFTSVKRPSPLGVVLYFPETKLDDIEALTEVDGEIIDTIHATEITGAKTTTQIDITLKRDASYDAMQGATGLTLSFDGSSNGMPAAATSDATPLMQPDKTAAAATRLETVQAQRNNEGVMIAVKADGAIKEYKSFTVGSPARVIYDLYNVKSPFTAEQTINVDAKSVKRVRYHGYPDRVRLVVDTHPSYLSAFKASPVPDGLTIQVSDAGPIATAAPGPKPATAATMGAGAEVVNRVDFNSEMDGKSTIIIGTSGPVEYKLVKENSKKILLNLINTHIPDYRRRPLITTRFESAVNRITPYQSSRKPMISTIAIELREAVPYFVDQTGNLLTLHFEPSQIPPKPFEQANLPAWKKAMTQDPAAPMVAQVTSPQPDQKSAPAEAGIAAEPPFGSRKQYDGEKIALDFFETDIRNVFRILQEVSGKNFAIDKNVAGTVTLTIEKPVPWDQVLDLILRMNQLGTIVEGDIIRIATLASIRQEEELLQAKIAAQQKTKEQQVALEPLYTEYIPINYAQANIIVGHLGDVLTKERGSLSVDERTNTIIFTDVRAKIQRAKEIVRQLDKPTAQVVIEARIVEANSDFARSLGVIWDLDFSTTRIYDGFDLNSSVNNPSTGGAASNGVLGFSVARLTDSFSLEIDAQIQANESTGDLKIISAPKVVTLDNQEAVIKQGVEFPYQEESESGGTTTQFKDIDLQLTVTPHVTNDDRIDMSIEIMKNDIAQLTPDGPAIATKEAKTQLLVNDGETVVIGGINKNTIADDDTAVPYLARVPVLGWLFKSDTTVQNKEELLIFITPRILRLEQR